MKILLIMFLAFTFLMAKSQETCYTVQLTSKFNSKKNFDLLSQNSYPQSCKLMEIGNSLTVRCGCFEKYLKAEDSLYNLKEEYDGADISTTYKYRFDTLSKKKDEKSSIEKNILLKSSASLEKKDEIKQVEEEKRELSKDTCYTVQLVSKYSSKKNLNVLNKSVYPENCKLMEIGDSLTVRCGCFERFNTAKELQTELLSDYKQAAIAQTYKSRFSEDKKGQTVRIKKRVNKTQSYGKNDEELRLIMQVFLYDSDLENAYKVATTGYEKYPFSYYWNQKMAEVCKWTNRSARSMKHLRNMYNINYNKKLEDELITYGTSAYQYEEIEPLIVSRVAHNPTEKNIDHMILVYKKIGSPEKVINILEQQYDTNPQDGMLLTKALELSFEIGDLELAGRFVEKIQKNKPYKKIDAALIAKYYYVQQDIAQAYENLSHTDQSDKASQEYNIKYYQLKSDLGWYLQDNLNAATASKSLMEMDEARLADYERISFVFQKTDPKLAAEAMKKAYEEYKLSYLFYAYANEAVNSDNYEELSEFIERIDNSNSAITNESLYWIVKSNVYEHYNDKFLEKSSLVKALELDPENYQIKLTLMYYYMRIHDTPELRNLLTEMADTEELDYSYYFPMASGYFYLSDINRASYYTQELLHLNSPVTKLTQFKFLQAYIYQIQNNKGAFKTSMKNILKDLKAESKEDEGLKTQDEFNSNYLRAAMYVINADKFEKKLKNAKKYLSKTNYDEISYSWAMHNNADEKGLNIYHNMDIRELWVELSNSMVFQKHDEVEDLLSVYLPSLSMGDASQAIEKDGQIALAQSFTFDGYAKNDNNQNAYIHHRDLSKVRTDALDIKVSHYNREPLLQRYIKIENETYLQRQLYLDVNLEYYINETRDEERLVTVPDKTFEAGFGIRKIFERGSVSAHLDYYDSMEKYYGGSLAADYRFSTDLSAGVKVVKNDNALESTQLLLGGKKDTLAVDFRWEFLKSTSLNLLYEKNDYTSQDEVDLGDGHYARMELIHQIRSGYPDIRVGGFIDLGLYDETSGTKGVIDELKEQNESLCCHHRCVFVFSVCSKCLRKARARRKDHI